MDLYFSGDSKETPKVDIDYSIADFNGKVITNMGYKVKRYPKKSKVITETPVNQPIVKNSTEERKRLLQ